MVIMYLGCITILFDGTEGFGIRYITIIITY